MALIVIGISGAYDNERTGRCQSGPYVLSAALQAGSSSNGDLIDARRIKCKHLSIHNHSIDRHGFRLTVWLAVDARGQKVTVPATLGAVSRSIQISTPGPKLIPGTIATDNLDSHHWQRASWLI